MADSRQEYVLPENVDLSFDDRAELYTVIAFENERNNRFPMEGGSRHNKNDTYDTVNVHELMREVLIRYGYQYDRYNFCFTPEDTTFNTIPAENGMPTEFNLNEMDPKVVFVLYHILVVPVKRVAERKKREAEAKRAAKRALKDEADLRQVREQRTGVHQPSWLPSNYQMMQYNPSHQPPVQPPPHQPPVHPPPHQPPVHPPLHKPQVHPPSWLPENYRLIPPGLPSADTETSPGVTSYTVVGGPDGEDAQNILDLEDEWGVGGF